MFERVHDHADQSGKGFTITACTKAGNLTARALGNRFGKSAGDRLKIEV